MPTIGDYLQSQNSIGAQASALMPAVPTQIATDLAQRSAQAITATSPQLSRQDQSAMMGGLTPSSMRSMMAPQRGGMQQANLDFAPVQTWSEGLSGGIGNAMAMRQANQQNQFQQQQQSQIMDFYRQQQQAVIQAEQQKIAQRVPVIKNLIPNLTDEQAYGLAQSETFDKLAGSYQPLADQTIAPQVGQQRTAQALQVVPTLNQSGQPNPITPVQQQELNTIYGAPASQFNQYGPQNNLNESQKGVQEIKAADQTYAQTNRTNPIEVKQKTADVQGKVINNALDKFNLDNAPMKMEIDRLTAQGKFDEAALEQKRYNDGMTLFNQAINNPEVMGNPTVIRGINARLTGMGFKGEIPEAPKVETVGSGKQTMIVAPNGQLVSPQDYNRMVQQPVVTQQPAVTGGAVKQPTQAKTTNVVSKPKAGGVVKLSGDTPAARVQSLIAAQSNMNQTNSGEADSLRRQNDLLKRRAQQAEEQLKKQQAEIAQSKKNSQVAKDTLQARIALRNQYNKSVNVKSPKVGK